MTNISIRHTVLALAAVLSVVVIPAAAQDQQDALGAFNGYDRVFEQQAPCNPALQNC